MCIDFFFFSFKSLYLKFCNIIFAFGKYSHKTPDQIGLARK